MLRSLGTAGKPDEAVALVAQDPQSRRTRWACEPPVHGPWERNVTLPFVSASNTKASNQSHTPISFRKLNFDHMWTSGALGDALGGVPHWEVGGDILPRSLHSPQMATAAPPPCRFVWWRRGDFHLRRHLPRGFHSSRRPLTVSIHEYSGSDLTQRGTVVSHLTG